LSMLSLYGLYPGGMFFLSLLLRFSGNQLIIQVSILFILFFMFVTLFEYFNPCSFWVKVVFVV
jgi:hypothetical protein